MTSQTPIALDLAARGVTNLDLRREDCVDGLRSLDDESVDVIVTSPPYNIATKYRSYDDRSDRSAYLNWCCSWGTELSRVLRPQGSLFLNVGASPSNPLLPHQLVLRFSDFLVLQNTIHWIKSISIALERGSHLSHGHFKPIRSPKFLNGCQEFVFHFTKTGRVKIDRLSIGVPYQHKSNIKRWNHTQGRDKRFTVGISSGLTRRRFRWNWPKIASVFTALPSKRSHWTPSWALAAQQSLPETVGFPPL